MHKIRIVIKGKTISDVEIIEIPNKQTEQKSRKITEGLERLRKAILRNEVPAFVSSR